MVQWQIFLSFRGKDTRYGFTGFLFDALCREGFNTFMDDGGGLQNGDQISSSLSNAIKASRLSIVILSENYASSSWCLDELATILECKHSKNQLVWPIFYKVDPSNIRKLENNYGESMTKHEQQFGRHSERLQKWRSALFEVSNLSGDAYKTGSDYEYKFIKKIVEKVCMSVKVDVETEKNKLVLNRDLVRVKFEATDHKTEKVSDVVCEWLNDTEILIQDVENMMEQARTRDVQHDEFRKLLKKVMEQNMKYDEFIDPFSTPIPSLEHFSGKRMWFKSVEKVSNELFMALQDDNCSVIGLYGMPGSGKTTLVKAMGKKVKYLEIFHEVLFVKVTQNSNIRTIQNEIADLLDIDFYTDCEVGRAKRIFLTIERMNRPILVIFDDVGEKFDPKNVGILCIGNRCKILLTTRCKQDCDLMYGQRYIELELGPLNEEECWTLFQKHAFYNDDEEYSFSLMNTEREVASKGKGTVIEVGVFSRGKPIERRRQIFLSFNGEDTHYSFTCSPYKALCQRGITTFMDDGQLQTGDQISPSNLNAIEVSRQIPHGVLKNLSRFLSVRNQRIK